MCATIFALFSATLPFLNSYMSDVEFAFIAVEARRRTFPQRYVLKAFIQEKIVHFLLYSTFVSNVRWPLVL